MNKLTLSTRPADRLRYLVHVLAWIPGIVLAFNAWTNNLTANPIQAATQRAGLTAITLLALSLVCTPLYILFKWRIVLPLRRTIGIYAFLYALIHMFIFTVVDYGLDFELLFSSIIKKPYIIVGATTFLILLSLAATSFNIWKKRLGKSWKRLHKWVYLAAPLAGLHFAWALKGDIFQLRGDIFWPAVYLISISMMLIVRIPWIKRRITRNSAQPIRKEILTPKYPEN
jgi:sulfoxide reductase heme-binding subunit YedZ